MFTLPLVSVDLAPFLDLLDHFAPTVQVSLEQSYLEIPGTQQKYILTFKILF